MAGKSQSNGPRRGTRARMAVWCGALLLFLLPLFAMLATDHVAWSGADFAVFGALLLGVCVAFELAARQAAHPAYRSAVGAALAAAFLMVWMNGAVGIIGAAGDPANLMFGGVLAVGLIGSVMARFKPRGMARVMIATALAQGAVGVVAVVGGFGATGRFWPLKILALTAFFTALWLLAARLFRKAARGAYPVGELPPRGTTNGPGG